MKVYIATAYDYNDAICLGVFSSQEKAMAAITEDYEVRWAKSKNSKYSLDYIIKAGNYTILSTYIDKINI